MGAAGAQRAARRVRPAHTQGEQRAARDQARLRAREGPQLRLLHRRAAADPREGHRSGDRGVHQATDRRQGHARPRARRDRLRARVGHRHRGDRLARAGAGDAQGNPRVDRQGGEPLRGRGHPHSVRRQRQRQERARPLSHARHRRLPGGRRLAQAGVRPDRRRVRRLRKVGRRSLRVLWPLLFAALTFHRCPHLVTFHCVS
mmetsp:Transcript_14675/g.34848  ORF Transcript_14675/g.34848 Transcript_14675/m.34848 type:complete len:202 (-) Transcript_14675:115-720(-)